MKIKIKTVLIIIAVIVTLFAACASSAPTVVISEPELDADTTSSFDGYWELPNGQLQIFKENAFVLMNNEGTLISAGIFTCTDTQFVLNLESELYVIFDYIFESGNLMVSGSGNEWAHGVWKRARYNDSNDNPLVGYWEKKTESEIQILHILSFGMGTWYTCDVYYDLIEKFQIRYEDNNRSEFRLVRRGDDFSISFPITYKFDGEDLIVEENQRYIKK